jgi:hypothetical protein
LTSERNFDVDGAPVLLHNVACRHNPDFVMVAAAA